jgi:hypothetical protein
MEIKCNLLKAVDDEGVYSSSNTFPLRCKLHSQMMTFHLRLAVSLCSLSWQNGGLFAVIMPNVRSPINACYLTIDKERSMNNLTAQDEDFTVICNRSYPAGPNFNILTSMNISPSSN